MLSWIGWMHPHMPWDASVLMVGRLDQNGQIVESTVKIVAGVLHPSDYKSEAESIFQPMWLSDSTLHFVSDRAEGSGWWNIYTAVLHEDNWTVEPVCPMEAEFGQAQWQFGLSTYAISNGKIIAASLANGLWSLGQIVAGSYEVFALPYTNISCVHAMGDYVLFVGASADTAPVVVLLSAIDPNKSPIIVRRGCSEQFEGFISVPQPLDFPTGPVIARGENVTDEYESSRTIAHALYYAPTNRNYNGPADSRPPLIVRAHGGPTGITTSALNLQLQYFTSRGFAVLDVNYRGSTGFGRTYRDMLYGNWGKADVEDLVCGARSLVERGLADPRRLIAIGGSAGGYTTLAALTFYDTFSAGASLYGVSDLLALAGETHKFESRYLDRLVGKLPECEELYKKRSPLANAEKLGCPCIFLQGLDDKVVPPNQAEAMVEALAIKGVPVAYVPFAGEGHGFRAKENICRSLESQLAFFGKVLGFEPADSLPLLDIKNLTVNK